MRGYLQLLVLVVAVASCSRIDYPSGWQRPDLELPRGASDVQFDYFDDTSTVVSFKCRRPAGVVKVIAERLLRLGWTELKSVPTGGSRVFVKGGALVSIRATAHPYCAIRRWSDKFHSPYLKNANVITSPTP